VLLQEKGLTDAGMRAFAMTNLLQGDAGVQWQINLEGIKRLVGRGTEGGREGG